MDIAQNPIGMIAKPQNHEISDSDVDVRQALEELLATLKQCRIALEAFVPAKD